MKAPATPPSSSTSPTSASPTPQNSPAATPPSPATASPELPAVSPEFPVATASAPRLGLIFGGASFEHEISIVSAIVLKKIIHEPLAFIFCSAERELYLIRPEKMNSATFATGAYKGQKRLRLGPGGLFARGIFGERKLKIDCLINLIHGADGEDGTLAGLLDFYGLPFIGPGIEASALSFNKELTKLLAAKLGLRTLPYQMLRRGQSEPPKLSYPAILKPARLGSSIGLALAGDAAEFDYALDVAFEFDEELLVEEFRSGVREFNLAGCAVGGDFIFSAIEEPAKKDLLDFEQKYLAFSNEGRAGPAELAPELAEKLRENFKKIYDPLFRGALIRCDFFLIRGRIYLNEINPCPGSLAHYLFEDFNGVIRALAAEVLSQPRRKKIRVDYAFLNSIKGSKAKL